MKCILHKNATNTYLTDFVHGLSKKKKQVPLKKYRNPRNRSGILQFRKSHNNIVVIL